MTPDLLDQLRINPEDTQEERTGKLRLWGRHLCLCEGDCPG